MAFPEEIITFPTMMDINIADGDGPKVAAYQTAMEQQDLVRAAAILQSITNYDRKIINANFWNRLLSLAEDLEHYYIQRYSPAYVVQADQPTEQGKGDFWFQVIDNE